MQSIKKLSLILILLNINHACSMNNRSKNLLIIENLKVDKIRSLYQTAQKISGGNKKTIEKILAVEFLYDPDSESANFLKNKKFQLEEYGLEKAFNKSIFNNDLEKAKILLEFQEIKPESEDFKKRIFLAACTTKNYKLVQSLIKEGINVNYTSTPDFGSYTYEWLPYLKEDSALNRMLSSKNRSGNDQSEYYETIKLFLKHGAKLDHGELRQAIEYNQLQIAKLFIENGAGINALYNGKTILELIINKVLYWKDPMFSRFYFIEFLLNNGADPKIRNHQGYDAFEIADQSRLNYKTHYELYSQLITLLKSKQKSKL